MKGIEATWAMFVKRSKLRTIFYGILDHIDGIIVNPNFRSCTIGFNLICS